MLASVRGCVECESVCGFGTVTFCNTLIMNQLQDKTKSEDGLVSLPEDGDLSRGFPAEDAGPCSPGLLHGDAAERGFRRFLDLLFALGVTAPGGARETLFDGLAEVL